MRIFLDPHGQLFQVVWMDRLSQPYYYHGAIKLLRRCRARGLATYMVMVQS